jgi:hypothetical protein
MSDPFDKPDAPKPPRDKEYQDFHFHDDDEIVPADDVKSRKPPPVRRKPTRRQPFRHRRYDDD